MLVLSRTVGEQVVLYDRQTRETLCTITFVRYGCGVARLGFDAPENIGIDRAEILERRSDDDRQNHKG